MDSSKMVEIITAAMEDRKSKNVEVINVTEATIVTDYFVIASGTSTTHLRGIADEVIEKMEQAGINAAHLEGYETAQWICIDFTDVVVHIFLQSEREFYNIERLWRTGGTYNKKEEKNG